MATHAVRTARQRQLADDLFKWGAVAFGEFELKMHEAYPDAPKSPIYISIRPLPKGVLTVDQLEHIGAELYAHAKKKGLEYDHICGLPKAGTPLAEGFIKAAAADGRPGLINVVLIKEETTTSRRLTGIDGQYPPGKVLVLDDLITKSETKLEAIELLRSGGFTVVACLVVVDREQGGEDGMSRAQVALHWILPFASLLRYYVKQGKITRTQLKLVSDYQTRVDEFMATQPPT